MEERELSAKAYRQNVRIKNGVAARCITVILLHFAARMRQTDASRRSNRENLASFSALLWTCCLPV